MILIKKSNRTQKQIGSTIRFAFIIWGFASVFMACSNEAVEKQNPELYFDIKAFMEQQITLLDSLQPELRKSVKGEEARSLKSVNWQTEFKLFLDANINRQIFEGLYSVEESKEEGKYVTSYQTQKAGLKTRFIKVIFDPSQTKVERIEVQTEKSNMLYESKNTLIIVCENNTQIKEYSIQGYQHTAFGTDTDYEIKGEILW